MMSKRFAMETGALRKLLAEGAENYDFDVPLSSITSIRGTTGIIRIHGPLLGRKYSAILDAITEVSRPAIKRVILDINSPGGSVDPRLDQAYEAIFKLRKEKTVVAVNTGIMASAAYWIGSAAEKIYTTSELTIQGSIGVYAGFYDTTEAERRQGVRRVRVVSRNAPRKNLPEDDPGLIAEIQRDLDYIEEIFLNRIATGRRISVQRVSENFGKGALLTVPEAIQVGMLDGIVPMDQILTDKSANVSPDAEAVPAEPVVRSFRERVLTGKHMEGRLTEGEAEELRQLKASRVPKINRKPGQHRGRTIEERVRAVKRLEGKA